MIPNAFDATKVRQSCKTGLMVAPGMEKVSDHGTNWSQKKI